MQAKERHTATLSDQLSSQMAKTRALEIEVAEMRLQQEAMKNNVREERGRREDAEFAAKAAASAAESAAQLVLESQKELKTRRSTTYDSPVRASAQRKRRTPDSSEDDVSPTDMQLEATIKMENETPTKRSSTRQKASGVSSLQAARAAALAETQKRVDERIGQTKKSPGIKTPIKKETVKKTPSKKKAAAAPRRQSVGGSALQMAREEARLLTQQRSEERANQLSGSGSKNT